MAHRAVEKLEDLEFREKRLESLGEKQEQRVRYFEGTTLGLVGNYIIFQAIIFLSVTNHTYLSCNYRWIPFCLSFLIAVLFGITFKTFISNWEQTRVDYDKNFLQRDWIHYQIFLFPERESKRNSPDQLKKCDHQQQQQQQPEKLECDKVKLYQRYAFISLVSVSLFAYTVVILNACKSIIC